MAGALTAAPPTSPSVATRPAAMAPGVRHPGPGLERLVERFLMTDRRFHAFAHEQGMLPKGVLRALGDDNMRAVVILFADVPRTIAGLFRSFQDHTNTASTKKLVTGPRIAMIGVGACIGFISGSIAIGLMAPILSECVEFGSILLAASSLRKILRALDDCVADRALVGAFFMAYPGAAKDLVLGPVQQQYQARQHGATALLQEYRTQRAELDAESVQLRESDLPAEAKLAGLRRIAADLAVLDADIARAETVVAAFDERIAQLPEIAVALSTAYANANGRLDAEALLLDVLTRAPLANILDDGTLDAIQRSTHALDAALRVYVEGVQGDLGADREFGNAIIASALLEASDVVESGGQSPIVEVVEMTPDASQVVEAATISAD